MEKGFSKPGGARDHRGAGGRQRALSRDRGATHERPPAFVIVSFADVASPSLAGLPKDGSHLDLPIAAALMMIALSLPAPDARVANGTSPRWPVRCRQRWRLASPGLIFPEPGGPETARRASRRAGPVLDGAGPRGLTASRTRIRPGALWGSPRRAATTRWQRGRRGRRVGGQVEVHTRAERLAGQRRHRTCRRAHVRARQHSRKRAGKNHDPSLRRALHGFVNVRNAAGFTRGLQRWRAKRQSPLNPNPARVAPK